jgi:putative spermidine/putrescine transport system permease protein
MMSGATAQLAGVNVISRVRRIPRMAVRRVPYALIGVPTVFLLLFFVIPNAILLSSSVLKSEAQQLTTQTTLDNFRLLFGSSVYVEAILRTFVVGASVGVLVVLLAFPLAYFITRGPRAWRGTLIALALAPLLASVVVRTYGWYVLLSRDGLVNQLLQATGLTDGPVRLLPSTIAIIVGLAHSLIPYGVLTIMSALNTINPNLERAAMGLGAGRFRTFTTITLPLALPGIAAGFLLTFSVAISSYATPAILGGPTTEMMPTLIVNFMTVLLDWSLGSAMSAVLALSAFAVLFGAMLLGDRGESTQGVAP